MRAKLALALAGMLVAVPVTVFAMGLGEIRLDSALNQKLDARIELVSPTLNELDTLEVRLAEPAAYERYGLERSAVLQTLRFKVVREGDHAYVHITSTELVREPFLTFLVEADWAQGRLLREYTVLLDPPVFAQAPAAEPAPVQAPAATAEPTVEPYVPPAQTQTVEQGTVLDMQSAMPSEAPQTAPYTAPEATYGRIQRGETLSEIALAIKPADVSLNQMMIALFRENPEAFMGNINLLKQGSILRVPDAATVSAITRIGANAEVKAQIATWRGDRSGMASSGTVAEETSKLELVAPGAGSGEDAALGGGGEGEGGQARFEALQQELAMARQQLEGSHSDNQTLQAQVTSLEQEIEEVRRLLSVKDNQLLALQQQSQTAGLDASLPETQDTTIEETAPVDTTAGAEPATTESLADTTEMQAETLPGQTAEETADETLGETAAQTTQAAEEPATPQVVMPSEPKKESLLDTVMGYTQDPIVLGGLGGVLVLLILASILRRRKSGKAPTVAQSGSDWVTSEETEDDDETVVAEDANEPMIAAQDDDDAFAEPAHEKTMISDAPMEQTGSAGAHEDTMVGGESPPMDQNDPMSEADFHMAYGLYDQAADQIKKAIQNEPGRNDLKQKLVEIYFTAGNQNEFLAAARSLHAAAGVASPEWGGAVIMGRQLAPDDPLFQDAGTATSSGEVDLAFGAEDVGGDDSLSFELPETPAAPAAEAAKGGGDDALEFDLGDFSADTGADTGAADSGADTGTETVAMDMDLGNTGTDSVGTDSQSDFDKALEDLSSFGVDSNAPGAGGAASLDDSLGGAGDETDDSSTKLDLARAYIDMGDPDGAKSILDEVLEEGNAAQKAQAQELLGQIA